jgi:1-acyl-sn-glycerol-3-phosphate acyltransferase
MARCAREDEESMDGQSASGMFWSAASPETQKKLERHNRRIGKLWQRLLHRFLAVYVLGPWIYLWVRLSFRVRAMGTEHLRACSPHAIYAFRHFYEWDPFLTFFGSAWTRSLRRPHLHPNALVGHFWVKTRVRRAIATALGLLALPRGGGPRNQAIERASELLRRAEAGTVSIAPTGPIGESQFFDIRPGIGWLAAACPDVPVVPVTLLGVQGVRPGLGLFFRRPRVTIAFGRPFLAREIAGRTFDERVEGICRRVGEEWARLEGREAVPASGRVPVQAPAFALEER